MKKSKLKIIPLGGLEQIGMNITAFEYEDDIVVVDCGIAFPEDEMLGIDLVIPDVTYLKRNAAKVRGFMLTHGHEDHIGALPYVLKEINVPVYGTRLTIGLVENKLKEHNILKSTTRNCVSPGDTIEFSKNIKIECIGTNHSISDALALAIHTPAGIVVHSGDFKIDYTPIHGKPIDLQKFAELGKKGVLLLMADSTNAERKGYTMSESSVGKAFDEIFSETLENRIIVTTFASNVDRVQQIVNSAEKFNRKVVIEGRSMVNVCTTAMELGYLKVPDGMMIGADEMINHDPSQIVIITTGSQGEPMAALSRIASSTHRKIQIQKGDKVILSSKAIPGNEKTVSRVINDLFRKGADVIFDYAHVSGHACQEELKILHKLVSPKFFIPVHGEYRHLKKHAELAEHMGMKNEDIFILSSGDVLEVDEDSAAVTGRVPVSQILVDGLGVGDVGNIVLRDRQKLSQEGLIIVVITLKKTTGEVLAGPDIVSRGFVYVRESGDLMVEAKEVVKGALNNCTKRNINDWSKIKNVVKEELNEFLWQQIKRSPMILPIIMEV
ncbi:MAG: ribonuclease J [Firmicutes bacterium HGW-Firmicutes-7]|nr:MAG: ribonuclease J [Firmicutes bacterium HGW-Firmicutes-7]